MWRGRHLPRPSGARGRRWAERWSWSATDAHPSESRSNQMSKSVAVVTGASQGIGQATAIRLARDFSALVLVARNRANLEQTAKAVRAAGAQASIIDLDLGQPSAAQTVVDRTLQAFGRID